MKSEDTLGIFQDPLLTIVALILVSSLWAIIPGDSAQNASDDGRIDFLKEIANLKEQIREIEITILNITGEIEQIKMKLPKAKRESSDERIKQEDQLVEQIAELNSQIQAKKIELAALQEKVKALKDSSKQKEEIEEIEQRIAELRDEISRLEALLTKLDVELSNLDESLRKQDSVLQEQSTNQIQLQHQIDLLKEEQLKLAGECQEIDESLQRNKGIGIYSEAVSANKEAIIVEVRLNMLYYVNDKNYDYEVYNVMRDGKPSKVVKLTRKSYIQGESIQKIGQPMSEFQKCINEKTPESNYFMFTVHPDSYEAFLAARQIAWQKGFAVGWLPWDEDSIYAGSGGAAAARKGG